MSEAESGKKGMPAWGWVLIGCGGVTLLGVVAVGALMVIGAMGFTKARSAAYQAGAAASMTSYCAAQVMYKRNDWDGNGVLEYATPYTRLCSTKDPAGNELMYIDPAFAAAQGPAGSPKHGYLYQDLQTIGGNPIDWINEYGLCGLPGPGGAGRQTFIVREDGSVFGKAQAPGAGFVTDYPADPAATGWILAY